MSGMAPPKIKTLHSSGWYRGCYLRGFYAALEYLRQISLGIDTHRTSEDVVRDCCEYRGIGPHRSCFIWGSQDAFLIATTPDDEFRDQADARIVAAGISSAHYTKLSEYQELITKAGPAILGGLEYKQGSLL